MKPGNVIMQTLYNCFYLAEKAHQEGRLEDAKKYYNTILRIGNSLYQEAREYIRERIALESTIGGPGGLAPAYCNTDRIEKAKAVWHGIISKAEVVPLKMDF